MIKLTKLTIRELVKIKKINQTGPRSIRASKDVSGYLAVVEQHETATKSRNFPGPPDAGTRFPMTMEIDYVRVYSGEP